MENSELFRDVALEMDLRRVLKEKLSRERGVLLEDSPNPGRWYPRFEETELDKELGEKEGRMTWDIVQYEGDSATLIWTGLGISQPVPLAKGWIECREPRLEVSAK